MQKKQWQSGVLRMKGRFAVRGEIISRRRVEAWKAREKKSEG